MEPFGRLPFLFPLAWFFQDICFGWVTMAAVSFIWGSFCLMNGKGWEILKISPSARRENRAALMSSHKAGVEQESAWPRGARNGLKPCLLVWSLPKPSLSCDNAICHAHFTQWTSLSPFRLLSCPPQSVQPLYCNQPLGGGPPGLPTPLWSLPKAEGQDVRGM